jgi:hypothetical protein
VKFWFWFLWSIDAVIAVVALYFFFSLGAHRRVASFNIPPWFFILAALAAVVGGSVWLRSVGRRALAITLLLLLAIPTALFVLFFLLILIIQPDFR